MASKSSIPLFSKAAREVLSHSQLTVLGSGGDDGDTAMSEYTTDPSSVPASLIRLSSLEELMSLDGDKGSCHDEPPSGQEASSTDCHYITLNQLSTTQETRKDTFCNTCQTGVASREEQVEHYQLDWHRYNLRRRLKGLTHVPQEAFETVAGGDVSSISGSESDSAPSDKEDVPHPLREGLMQTPFIYFTTADKNGQKLFAIYRSLVTRVKRGGATLEAIKSLTNDQVWIILMRSGGHFAGAVFKGSAVVAHKTFHRYTVRAKRGTAQSVRDAQGGGHGPKSAGASLRRYNEAALAQEIQELVSSWDHHVREADAIFIRTPKYSRDILVGGPKAPFLKDDPRLRDVPFPTRRPTLSEVKRVHSQLASLYKVPLSALVEKEPATRKPPQVKKNPSPSASKKQIDVESDQSPKKSLQGKRKVSPSTLKRQDDFGAESSDEEADNPHSEVVVEKSQDEKVGKKSRRKKPAPKQEMIPEPVQKLLKICRDPEDNVELLCEQLHSLGFKPHPPRSHDTRATSHDTEQQEATVDNNTIKDLLNTLYEGLTVLHVAAVTGNVSMVNSLLLHGADPVVKDQGGKTPYLVSKDKAVRDSFRRFMASHPAAYDYDSAHIPSALTEEMEKERREKINEKKKVQKKARKQREKEMRSSREVERISLSREKQMEELSEREKRAMAAERRLASQLPSATAIVKAGQCCSCGGSLAGVVPFQRLKYSYCSMNCLKQHREQLDMQAREQKH